MLPVHPSDWTLLLKHLLRACDNFSTRNFLLGGSHDDFPKENMPFWGTDQAGMDVWLEKDKKSPKARFHQRILENVFPLQGFITSLNEAFEVNQI